MRYAASRGIGFLTALLLAAFLSLLGTSSQAQPLVVLDDNAPVTDLQASSLVWVDVNAGATIEQMAAGDFRRLMSAARTPAHYTLGPEAALWQHFRFKRSADSRQDWLLEFPFPMLDQVTVFQRDRTGRWTSQTAGDTVAVSSWPEPGRYAQFHLALEDETAHDVYVRIAHVTPAHFPVNAISGQARSHQLQFDYMVIGVVFGTLLLLIVAGAGQSWVYRDWAYGWYAIYATIMALVVATTSGMAGHLLWSNFADWNNAIQGVLGLLGGCAALLVVRKLCGIAGRHRWFDQTVYATGLAGPLLAFAYIGLDRQWGVHLIGAYLLVIVVLGLATAYTTWRRHDVVGAWVLAAFTPLALSTALAAARIFGWVPTSWLSQYAFMLSLAVEVPLLLVALNIRSRERHGVEAREQAMASQDALTGLLARHLFEDRLKQVVSRAKRHREPAAVVYVELVNYGYVKRNYGIAVAEQSLLRSVIKLRRIMRDVDTAGRVDEACFGLIMEGVSSREVVTAMAARLIAAGLMPLKGLKPEVILQFHVAAVLLSEKLMDGPELSRALETTLAGMAARTRRPIRFLDPELTRPMPLAMDSGFDEADVHNQPA
ncbi:MAG: 7TM diverse intracellular signaling domain-containing protein [Polaromonas sp.]|uniref:sensor domain-containing diguanylate cyclase n=1 Tax=Polaromonas sp. TaxID=1869339 RepID=UPI0027214041|nr:7TM diverse intracellular signaling domain-containing protein [Polaromonas sp.]MDO9113829.1 7TM diverse intracellular signaling domain-containing protein [Polaromonas sp.]MDP1888450.1 7TM diverse intracellular signaling domain-containing protein [Polaromonas sp.]